MRKPSTDVNRIFHALGDPTRRAMVERLSQGPVSASKLAAPLGITLTAVGQHLQVLQECGLIETQKVGRVRTCGLDTAGLAVLEQWIRERRSAWECRLDRLGEILAEED